MQAIEQFRARYPQGGLVSEFLTREGGNYLVKVTVQADDMVLATGLAAAEVVEVAEDRARQRALAAVGIGALGVSSAPAATEAIAPTTPYTSAFPDLDLPDPVAMPVAPVSGNGSHNGSSHRENGVGLGDNPQPSIWEARAAATAVETVAPPATDAAKPKATKKRTTKAKKAEPAPEPVADPTPVPAPEPTLPALDAAEVVTRAKAELKRLGWTREQGQKFLLTRYGKRETRQLDDREWRDFYDYLYQQPNPTRATDAS